MPSKVIRDGLNSGPVSLDFVPNIHVLPEAVNEYQSLATPHLTVRNLDIAEGGSLHWGSLGHSYAVPFLLRPLLTLAIVTSLYYFS